MQNKQKKIISRYNMHELPAVSGVCQVSSVLKCAIVRREINGFVFEALCVCTTKSIQF